MSYSQTGIDICKDALQHLGALGVGETIDAEDAAITLRGLDSVLKELAVYGYNWPMLSAEASLAWSGTQIQTLPDDYFDHPIIYKTTDKIRLRQMSHAEWTNLTNSTVTGEPTAFYISPAKEAYLWPVPTVDPDMTLQYQRIVPDSELTTDVPLTSYWVNALGYGVADAVAFKYQVDKQLRAEIADRWREKRLFAMRSATDLSPIVFDVVE